MNDKIPATMQRCIDYMKEHNNRIARFRGGHWGCRHCWEPGMPSHGTATIDAMVARRLAEIIDWQRSESGVNFKAEIELVMDSNKCQI